MRAALQRNRAFIKADPHPRQADFLSLPHREALYGGAAGGGKSIALIIGALMYVDVPGYSALILRRSYADLWQEGGIGDVLRKWLGDTDARWVGTEATWFFPSGAKIRLGYVGETTDILRYQGGEYHYIAWDELTQLRERDYRYLFSRVRRAGLRVPLRVRAATNPGGPGHAWVMTRFIDPGDWSRPFVPAKVDDNPSLDQDEYLESLENLDPITLAQLRDGDWTAAGGGGMFNRATIEIVEALPNVTGRRPVRAWDLAATDDAAATLRNTDPDYTAGVRAWALDDGYLYVDDVIHGRWGPGEVEEIIAQTAKADGKRCRVRLPQDPGQAGVHQIHHFKKNVIPLDVTLIAELPSGKKWDRARPAAGLCGKRRVRLVRGPWVAGFLAELEAFSPADEHDHDDRVDAFADAVTTLLPEMKRTADRLKQRASPGYSAEPQEWREHIAEGRSHRARDITRKGFYS